MSLNDHLIFLLSDLVINSHEGQGHFVHSSQSCFLNVFLSSQMNPDQKKVCHANEAYYMEK